MDKYEFNIKVEQIKKLVNKGDYETAMKIADSIDWRRVRSTSLLTMVAQVYERNEEYQDAKDILLMAFERAPIGKGLLFKLTDLALREGNVQEAEAYYREFCDLSGDDPRQNLLRYLILEAKEAPTEQQINSLERYCRDELDEKWMYHLAELYKEAGREDDCVRMCDKIMLMFGLGKYVDKAMELKLQFAPLSKYQMDLVENREKYEEKLRAVEEAYKRGSLTGEEEFYDSEENTEEIAGALDEENTNEAVPAEGTDDIAKEAVPAEDILAETVPEETAPEKEMSEEETSEAELAASIHEAAAEEELAKSVSELTSAEETVIEDWDLEDEEEEEPENSNHLMIEAEDAEKGLALALESLKKIHNELGFKNPVAKISGEKLSKKGIFAVADRLAGKDLVVEHAFDLNAAVIEELNNLMERDETGMIVVLIDTPARMERLHRTYPGLAGRFQYIGCDAAENAESRRRAEAEAARARLETERQEEEARRRLAEREEEIRRQAARDAQERRRAEEEAAEAARYQAELAAEEARRQAEYEARRQEEYEVRHQKEYEASAEYQEEEPGAEYEEAMPENGTMDVEEFVQYACKYAAEIDCSISGKSMLALYERAEMMEEDGEPLTKLSAEDLIEYAADQAEKKSFGDLFSSKYDKEGLLILKEKHFFD